MSLQHKLLRASSSRCRTVDRCDIFGDGSGIALYRLDGNANDESGNYHGTETAITYGGGVYERGAIATSGKIDCGAGSKALIPHNENFTISGWVKRVDGIRTYIATRMNASSQYGDSIYWESDNKIWINFATSATTQVFTSTTSTYLANGNYRHICYTVNRGTNTYKVYVDNVEVAMGSITIPTVGYDNNLNTLLFSNHSALSSGQLDQMRFFNRAITATEVVTLYAECAPTSTVDNINPFEDGSLKALYQFNGDATDATGVYNGTATNVTYGTGKFGQAVVISAGKVDTGTKLLMPSNASFSVAAWVKITPAQINMIAGRMNSASSYGLLFYWNNSDSAIKIGIPTAVTTQTLLSTPAVSINDGIFHHVCLTLDYSRLIVKVYIDGNLIYTSGTIPATQYDNNLNVLIGANHNSNLYGTYDQHRFFNKVLTPMEVASLYCETTPLEEPMHSLVDPFKDGSGKALYRLDGNALDESGNYNGTATNMVWSAGRFGRCGVFNGSSSVITSATYPSFIVANAPHTVSLWLKNSDITNVRVAMVLQYNNIVINYSSGNTLTVTTWQSGVGVGLFTTISMPSTTDWFHLVKTYDGVNVNVYINSVLQTPLSTISSTSGSTGLVLGRNSSAANYWSGSIDQVRIFNRALTVGEVTTLYTEI